MSANRWVLGFALLFLACGGNDLPGTAGADGVGAGGVGGGGSDGEGRHAAVDMAAPSSASVDLAQPPKPVVRFVAMGDTGKGNAGQKNVAAAVKAKCDQDGCDFIQLLGDNFYDSGVSSTTDPLWQSAFEEPYMSINKDFWVVLGNHDYGGNGIGNEFSKGKHQVEYAKTSSKFRLPDTYYRRTVQHVELFGLDTNMQMYGLDDQQKSEVKNWVAASQATWKIAFGHHPYRSNGPHGNAGNYEGLPSITPVAAGNGVKKFLDEAICGKVDLYVAGHDHSRQWITETCQGTELIVSGAGAAATELKGSNATYFQSNELGFVYIVVEGKTLTAEFVDATGKGEFSRTLTKP